MNLGDMKLYQEFEERERARWAREAERRLETHRRRQKDFEDIYGITPQKIVCLTTDNLLRMPFNRTQEMLEKAMMAINKLSDEFKFHLGNIKEELFGKLSIQNLIMLCGCMTKQISNLLIMR